jgi:arylsulfatase A-like enzyme
MTRPLLTIAVACLMAIGCSSETPQPAGERPPDLLLFVIDTLRADHLSTYGYHRPTSPRLDALAARGVVFEDATSQSSWTLPSMASMLSGRRMFENARRLPTSVPSLAERLQDAGYETAAFVGNPAVSRASGFARGFDHFITRDDTGGITWDAPDLEAAVRAWHAEHPPGDAPRFLYIHYLDPHWPYVPAEEVTLDGEPKLADDTLEAWMELVRESPWLQRHFNDDRESILADLDAYDREILVTDASLGRLLDTLGTREHVVVVSADHGEGLWDHPHYEDVVSDDLEREGRTLEQATLRDLFFRDHSYHMYEELIATPLIAAGPGLPTGARVDVPVENVDIAPTLLRAAGLTVDPALDGLPLQDVAGTGATRPFVYAHAKEATAVRRTSDATKLAFPTPTGDHFGMPMQLYDLAADPHERRNIASRDRKLNGDELERLRALIAQREKVAEAFDLFDGEDAGAIDDAVRRAMAELGYVGKGFEDEEEDGEEDAGR